MNKDDSGITATDAAAPAIAATDEAAPFTITDAPPAPSDVVEISEYYETDAELAEFALERFNAANSLLTGDDEFCTQGEMSAHVRLQATSASHMLSARALMRSAAALERQAAAADRADHFASVRRLKVEELHELQMKIGRLQLSAIEGDFAKLREIALIAFDFAQGLKDPPHASDDTGLPVIHTTPGDARTFVQKLELITAQLTPGTVQF